jgi:hypothetical protein
MEQNPTEEGRRRYPPHGYWDADDQETGEGGVPCTCVTGCPYGCAGGCGCSACGMAYCDAMEWD